MGNDNRNLAPAAECSESAIGLEERGWLVRHRRGDPQAFPALVNAYQRPLYSFLVRCGVDRASRDDLFQDIFLKLHASAAAYQAGKPLRPWVFTIAANTIRNHFRALRRHPAEYADDAREDSELEAVDASPAVDQRVESQQTLSWLERAISELPIAQRQVLVLVSVQEIAQSEVAAILDMPLNTVKTNLRRARLSLLAARAHRDAEEESR